MIAANGAVLPDNVCTSTSTGVSGKKKGNRNLESLGLVINYCHMKAGVDVQWQPSRTSQCPLPTGHDPFFKHTTAQNTQHATVGTANLVFHFDTNQRIKSMTNNMNHNRVCHFKLVLLGDTAVGKSCLVVRFVRDEFFEFQEPTIGGTPCSILSLLSVVVSIFLVLCRVLFWGCQS